MRREGRLGVEEGRGREGREGKGRDGKGEGQRRRDSAKRMGSEGEQGEMEWKVAGEKGGCGE